jgi:hypothetical protein
MPQEISFLAMTPVLDKAIREKLLQEQSNTDLGGEETSPKRQELISDSQESSDVTVSYSGYFTLLIRTLEDETKRLVVCDAPTYDSQKGTSGDSLAKVNTVMFNVKYKEFDIQDGYVYLMFVPESENELTGEVIKEHVAIMFDDKYLDRQDDATYLIGECSVDPETGDPAIIQRHGTSATMYMSNGVAYIEYIIECGK